MIDRIPLIIRRDPPARANDHAIAKPVDALDGGESRSVKLNFQGTRCVGVKVNTDGAVKDIEADREVILTAGAIGSPKLLMLSGVGDATALRGLGTSAPSMRTLAFQSIREWNFLEPVFIGDTIRLRTKVLEKEARSRGRRGVITWQRQIVNQAGKAVQEGVTLTLVEARGSASGDP